MIRVAIVGASGYTGAELTRILSLHPQVELVAVTSRQHAGKRIAEVFPHLGEIASIVCEDVSAERLAEKADCIFTAVPHQTAMNLVPIFLQHGCKVVDLSADFRIHDPAIYEKWYVPHTAVETLNEAVYGLPELHRLQIRECRLAANPGCYPTSVILGLAPLLKEKLVDPATLVVDSKSGTSGAGRGAQVGTLFCEVADGFRAYKVGEHRHTPEIEQELSLLFGKDVTISFTPHLVPMSRGILSTIYAKVVRILPQEELQGLYDTYYGEEYFVRVLRNGAVPSTQYVRGSNFCDIGFKFDGRTGRVIVISAIDNLVKGAAGQAVQNMNLMFGLDEKTALQHVPLFP
jgi:N-acetyl-gamma-glutamyl-phosphate reductase